MAVLVSNVAARGRTQALAAMERARTTEALYAFSRKLAGTATLDDVLWATAYQTALMLKVRVVLLLPERDMIAVKAGYPPEDILDSADIAAARWAWENDRIAGRGSDTLPGAKRLFLPMHTGRGAVGVMGIDSDKPGPLFSPDQRRLLDALRDQGALAIERVRLVEDMDRVERVAETERLRSALLTSISHDLKTPLAAVLGAAGTLRDLDQKLNDAEKADLLGTIIDKSERLNRFIANLLDMTKLESGAITPNIALHDVGEIVGSALRRASRILSHHNVELELASDLPMLDLDAVLFEQVLFNVLDNAAKYAPANTTIRIQAWRGTNSGIPAGHRRRQRHTCPGILSISSTSFTARKRPIRCAPAPAWDWRSRAVSSRPCAAPSWRPTAPTAPARSSPSTCRSRASGGNWTPPHERNAAPRACGRRRAADPQALADGTFRARLSNS